MAQIGEAHYRNCIARVDVFRFCVLEGDLLSATAHRQNSVKEDSLTVAKNRVGIEYLPVD